MLTKERAAMRSTVLTDIHSRSRKTAVKACEAHKAKIPEADRAIRATVGGETANPHDETVAEDAARLRDAIEATLASLRRTENAAASKMRAAARVLNGTWSPEDADAEYLAAVKAAVDGFRFGTLDKRARNAALRAARIAFEAARATVVENDAPETFAETL